MSLLAQREIEMSLFAQRERMREKEKERDINPYL